MVAAASLTAGYLMIALFQETTAAQVSRAEVVLAGSCDAIGRAYQFYTTNWRGPVPQLDSPDLHRDLTNVVQVALRDQPGVEGGIWQGEADSLAYAFPTYEGSGPKTDLPQAEAERIREINAAVLADDYQKARRLDGRSQVLLLHACPLDGVIPALTAWTMMRVATNAGQAFSRLGLGLGVLLACVVGAAALLSWLLVTWLRNVSRIEATLASQGKTDLPEVPLTGESDLDRIILALNIAGARLGEARRRSEAMTRQVAAAQRLAAIGRMTAAFAHEIRNPITAMRLKAENALAGDDQRRRTALANILEQIARLNRLVEQLLHASNRSEPSFDVVAIPAFIDSVTASYRERAAARRIEFKTRSDSGSVKIDSGMTGRALDNLIGNALEHVPAGGQITVTARRFDDVLRIVVRDTGPGIPAELREILFEPFVTGRPDGTGLGLSIAREAVESQGGHIRLASSEGGACFEIDLPWQPF